MATKRRPRPARSDDSSQEEEERAQQEKKGEEEAGKASPVRNVVADEVAASPRPKEGKPSGEVAASPKPKKMAATSAALPPSREKEGSEEEEQQQMEEDEESGEGTPRKNAPADGTAASTPERKKRTKPSGEVARSPEPKKMAATSPGPKRGVKSPSPQVGEADAPADEAGASSPRKRSKASGEVAASPKPKKRDATPTVEVHETVEALSEMGAPADGTAVSPPVPKKRSKPSRGKNAASPQRKKKKKKVKPSAKSQLESIGEEEEVVEQVPAQNTRVSLEMVGRTEEEQADEEQVDQSSEALPVVNALSAELCNSNQEKKLAVERTKLKKKPAVQRSWSKDDELRILRALVEHARIHDGELPEPSDLFAILAASFDRKDADAGRFASKIKKLKSWHGKMHLQGRPTDDHGSQLYDLCDKVWGWGNGALKNTGHGNKMVLRRSPRNINNRGHVVLPQEAHQEVDAGACKISFVERVKDGDVSLGKREGSRGRVAKDKQVKVTFVRREFDELSRLYPYLAKEVEGYADKHSSVDGKLIMEAFEAIGDDEASNLDASFKKQRIDMFNLEVKLVCTLSGLMN